MVVGEASIHNIMGGMMSTGGVRLHNHKRKLKQRFDIIKKLGQGTYGKVQLGINKETGQEVAIKTIKKCKIETEADLIRIRREIQIMSSVQHPNIIHIYEVFENREKMVLVMEYAAGGELYDYLSERKVLTEQEARRIFRQIATAVFYCHKHKICHRDLKLENILLDQVGNAKIADFGLSNVFDEQRLLNTFCGSPLYASPEIVKGTPYHGPEVDCWSLGVLLYTLVYGAMPFDGSNFKRLVKQISQSDYFEPKKPSPASPLIKDMLTVSPAKRAGIERICTHWWVNEGYEQNCLDIAEELAAQTPVRLDLLLSLVPQSASAEKLVVGDQRPAGDVPNNVSSETLVPTRCHSVGSLMELDRDGSDRRIRELLDEEPRSPPASGDAAKRKLETTPSMDETAAAGAKRKDRPKGKEKRDERETRAYRSAARHHSAPIPNSITEEAMEIEPIVTLPTVEPSEIESGTAACLELIAERNERSPSKERSETPLLAERDRPIVVESARTPLAEDRRSERGGRDREEDERPTRSFVEAASEAAGGFRLDPSDRISAAPESESANAIPRVATANDGSENATRAGRETIDLEETRKEFKKLKEKALSLDSELSSPEPRDVPAKTFERRRSRIFETAEKFNQMTSSVDNEKPKKIFIPGVNVGGAKRVFERKASLSSASVAPPLAKPVASKVIIDVSSSSPSVTASVSTLEAARKDKSRRIGGNEEGAENADAEKQRKEKAEELEKMKKKQAEEEEEEQEAAKKRAVDIITGAIGKPPVQKRINGSPPTSPPSQDSKRLPLKIPLGPNDSRSATVSVSTPVDTKFAFDENAERRAAVAVAPPGVADEEEAARSEEPKMSSKMEITLKSATLPRPRKTSKAEICLSGMKSADPPVAFRSEVEAKIDAFQPQRLRTQRSEVAFPVAAAEPHGNRSSSLEPDARPREATPRERIIPIRVEAVDQRQSRHASTPSPPSKPPPMPQRSVSQRSGSLSRQSTADSDTDSALGSAVGPEPIRKSPREYIIPIAVEGGGYVTPRAGSVEPEAKTATANAGSAGNAGRSRFGRPRRMSSLLSDASEDESPFSSLHRDSEDLLQRHMHRLRSSRPSRQPPEHADSLSSGEDDDDDGFELLTAENLFSTLLSRVRSLTQRLNVDDNRTTGFPGSRLFGRLGSTADYPQAFRGLNKPLSRRLSESRFRYSLSRDGDPFSRKDSVNSSSDAGTLNSPGSRAASSRETMYDIGGSGSNSNTLPRDKIARKDAGTEPLVRKGSQESLEQSFTPSLTRRLSRTLIERTGRSPTRSPSVSRHDHRSRSAGREAVASRQDSAASTISDQTEYGERSRQPIGRAARRSSCSPRRRVVGLFDDLFDDEDEDEAALGDDTGLARRYKDASSRHRRAESFRSYRTDKIQEETADDADNGSILSECDSRTNLLDATTSSLSAKSYETSPTESSSNVADHRIAAYKPDSSRNFENRLLAAENLIKESKLKNLGPRGCGGHFDPNSTPGYRDGDKCEKRSLLSIAAASGVGAGGSDASTVSKRRSCIPGSRLRSCSLTRESSVSRRRSFADTRDAAGFAAPRPLSPERSLLSKLFKVTGSRENESKEKDGKCGREKESEKAQQKSKHRRISRFLRPDFFDTPREESRYAKEKDAQREAENERRKSRFIRRKTEGKPVADERRESEPNDEIDSSRRDRCSHEAEENAATGGSMDENSRNGFLRSLEKRLERLRSANEQPEKEKTRRLGKRQQPSSRDSTEANSGERETAVDDEARERSAPPVDWPASTAADRPATTAAKRSSSVEDLSSTGRKPAGQSCSARSRVSSVFGLFKSADAKPLANGTRCPRTAIPSKSKRSPTKPAKSGDASVDESTNASGASKIPTKRVNAADAKTVKRIGNGKRADKPTTNKTAASSASTSVSSSVSECPKRSPPKEAVERRSGSPPAEREKPDSVPDVEAATRETRKAKRASLGNGSTLETNDPDDSERKTKRTVKKVTGTSESNEIDGAKKKKIVRVARKVVKKSSEGDAEKTTPESREKSVKTRTTRKRIGVEANGTVLASPARNGKARENGSEVRASAIGGCPSAEDRAKFTEDTVAGDAKNGRRTPVETRRSSRCNLKLDLSKIPQHSFRNSTPKRESPRSSGSPKPAPSNDEFTASADQPTDRPHRGKLVVEKPLRATDVAELKKEVTECARIIESRAAAIAPACQHDATSTPTAAATASATNRCASCVPKEPPIERANAPLSPTDEPESFDSWSISSAELCHARPPDLPSPTSPSRSLPAESVIDRIRRRSFYSRFNDRRRPSLTAPPPGVALPSSATLPRKFSFAGPHREHRDRGKYIAGYGPTIGSKPDRGYGFYSGDEGLPIVRNRSLDRGLYSDSEHATSLASSYDPLRRYLRSPTFDLSASRSRYHSADFATEPDLLAGCRPPLSGLSNDATSLTQKYGTGARRPKTVEYYEQLLTPSCPEYLPARRSAAGAEYPNKSENGYYHANLDSHSTVGKRKPYTENSPSLDLSERGAAVVGPCDDDASERERGTGERTIEARRPSSSAFAETTTASSRASDCG